MNRIAKLSLILAAAAPILACSLLSPRTPTVTAPPPATEAPGTSVVYGNVHLWIPPGLVSGTTNSTNTDVEFPYINPSNGEMPEHTRITLTGYAVQGAAMDPQIHVFPAAKFAAYTDLTQRIVSTLQGLQYSAGSPLPDGLPDGAFSAQVAGVSFANGRGVRDLTQFDQAVLPVNNHELIYYFRGLTDDGSWYVQVILPVQSSILAADGNPDSPVPTGGVPFKLDQLGDYFQSIATRLNSTAPGEFSPPLPALDALVQSLSIKP